MKDSKTFWLNYFRPSVYIKSYANLDVYSLKKSGIKMLICDLDNTLSPHFTRYPTKPVINFCDEVKRHGIIFVLASNNTKKRVTTYAELLKPDEVIWNAKKPLMRKIKKMITKYDLLNEEVVIMGDQFITDIWLANRIGCKSILVLPTVDSNTHETSSALIKLLERFIYKKLQHKNYLQLQQKSGVINEKYEII